MHMTTSQCGLPSHGGMPAAGVNKSLISQLRTGTASLRVARRSLDRSGSQPTLAQAKRGPKKDRPKKQKSSAATLPAKEPAQPAASTPPAPQQTESLPLAEQPVRIVDDDATTVGDRILPRIFLFSGVPVLLGLLTLPGFYYLKVVKQIDIPTFVVYIASFLFFGAGLAGISYGIFSSSWDPSRSGSLSGLDEFKENVPVFMKKKKK